MELNFTLAHVVCMERLCKDFDNIVSNAIVDV